MGDERVVMPPDGESGAAGAVRSQQVIVLGGMEPRTVQAALRPGVERARHAGAPSSPACVVLAPSLTATTLAAAEARSLLGDAAQRVVPVSSVPRATRVLALGPVAVVVATPSSLLALRRASALSVANVQAIVLLGLDDMLADDAAATSIESLLTDVAPAAVRVASVSSEDDARVDGFVERHLRKARQVTPLVKPTTVEFTVTPHYHIVAPAGRTEALRQLLDDRDPPSLAIVAPSAVAEAAAHEALVALGLVADGQRVQVTRGAPAMHTALVIGWEAPASNEALVTAMSAEPVEAVFFLQAGDVPAMTAASGGAARPLALPAIDARASTPADVVREALRVHLASGLVGAADLALVAPLLGEHDAVEIAAAAVRLYDDTQRALRLAEAGAAGTRAIFAAPIRAAVQAAADASAASGRTRLFFNVGKRDNVRPGDLLGAIAGESGLPGDRIGSIDLFESHTLVEVAADAADTVIDKLTGVTLRGRQLHVRRDERGAGGHAGFAGSRGADRGGDRGGRGFDRGARGFDKGGRGGPPRERGGDRGAARGGKSWEDRGEPRRSGSGGGFREGGSRDGGPRDGGFRGGSRDGGPRDGGFRSGSRDGGPREGGFRSGSRDGGPRDGGFRSGSREGGFRSGSPREGGFRDGGRRGDEARRAFGDRSPAERTEPRGEWSSRGAQLSRSQRPASGPRRGGLPFDRSSESRD